MRKNFKRRKNGSKIIFLVLVLVIILFAVLHVVMQPIVMRYAKSVAETIMLNSANKAIVNIFDMGNISYNDIVSLTNNDDGYVTSLEIDVFQINNLKSKISEEISRIIASQEHYNLDIPLGNFFANTYTNGLGPDLGFKMQITTTAFVDFDHEFKAAGINQVLHIVNVKIDIRGSFIVAGYNKSITTSTTAIAAQTVIVGKSPDAFTNVLESQNDNTGGLINDYGANAD